MPRLERDLRAIKSQVNREGVKFNDFLLENAFATISTAIEPGVRLDTIFCNALKGRILRYTKFALTLPDGSNPTIIEIKSATYEVGSTSLYIYSSGATWNQEIYPVFGYPVGSLISGLDYQVNTTNYAAGDQYDIQYKYSSQLAGASMDVADGGSPYDFSFNRASGVVTAEGFSGDGSALTNLPATSPSGPNYSVQFNGGSGSFGGDAAFTFNPTNDTLSCTNITAAYSGSYGYIKGKFRGDNIGTGAIRATGSTKYWYLTPQDFMFGSSSTSPNYSSTSGLTIRTWQYYSSYGKYIATIQIPSGYKVVSVFIKGSANLSWSAGVTSWSSSSGGFAGSGVVNTEATGLNWTSVEGDFYAISIQGSGSTQSIYGARLTLEEV